MSDPGDGRGAAPDGAPVAVGPWTRRTRRVAYANPWLTVWHDEVDRPDGSAGIYGVVHFASIAVGIVAIDAQDRVALVGQHRYTLDRHSWEIPEGGADPAEGALAGAVRELQEETGATARTWRVLGTAHLSNSVTDEGAVLFLATDLAHGADAREASEHDLACRWVPFPEVVAMCRDGRITDGLTLIAIGWAALDRAGVTRPPDVDTGAPGPLSSPTR